MLGKAGSRPAPRPSERPRRASEEPRRAPGEAEIGAARFFGRAEGICPKEPARVESPALETGGACFGEAPMGTVVTPKPSMAPEGSPVNSKEKSAAARPSKGRPVREVKELVSALLEPEDEDPLFASVKTVERRAVVE